MQCICTLYFTNKKKTTCITNHGLLLKELPLLDGIIQLCVGVADLLLHHKELKALGQTLLASVPAAKERAQAVDTFLFN